MKNIIDPLYLKKHEKIHDDMYVDAMVKLQKELDADEHKKEIKKIAIIFKRELKNINYHIEATNNKIKTLELILKNLLKPKSL